MQKVKQKNDPNENQPSDYLVKGQTPETGFQPVSKYRNVLAPVSGNLDVSVLHDSS